ncbi:MAG: hypothetical protein WBP26_00895 [Candidatus Saccharimonadales bacterium]
MTDSTILILAGGGLGLLLVITGLFLYARSSHQAVQKAELTKQSLERMAREDVDHIFNEEFREELRNMGRLHFQKIVTENAMFLKEDLRLTSSEINQYLKAEVTRHLQDSFAGYDQSLGDAKELALSSVQKITESLEQQRAALTSGLEADVAARKEQIMAEFEKNMAEVVNHYLVAAVGEQVDLNAQLQYILQELQKNKQAIIEDLKL